MIFLKSTSELELIKKAVDIWKKAKKLLQEETKVGVNILTLDEMVAKLIEENGATCSFYKYNGFPGHICISINEELIHGVPTNRLLKKNDMVTFDIGVTYKNHICDAAFTIVLDEKNSEANNINKATLEALENAIYCIKPGNHIGDISYAIEKTASKHGYEVIKDFGGHGCGNYLHEDPIIYCFGKPHTGTKIVKGMVLCIEPMFLIGTDKYIIDKKNKWSVISVNKKLTCHWEHMVYVTDDGCEILTK